MEKTGIWRSTWPHGTFRGNSSGFVGPHGPIRRGRPEFGSWRRFLDIHRSGFGDRHEPSKSIGEERRSENPSLWKRQKSIEDKEISNARFKSIEKSRPFKGDKSESRREINKLHSRKNIDKKKI